MNNKTEELLLRVAKSREFLKRSGVKNAKTVFFDSAYGAMYKSETNRIDNLWEGRVTDVDFTERLEKFCKNPVRNLSHDAEFTRFQAFMKWYTKMGGRPLTKKQIERAYPKFQI